jgi:hypothetical protein
MGVPRLSVVLVVPLAALMAGCAHREPIPRYSWQGPGEALRIMADRATAVRTVSSQADLTLYKPGGDFIRLDAAAAMRIPGYLRLRAWKFGQAVFDLTYTPEGLWLVVPPEMKGRASTQHLNARQLARAWPLMTGEFFTHRDLKVEGGGGSKFKVIEPQEEGAKLVCEVDRDTLTPRRYTVVDSAGKQRFELLLTDYRGVGETVWPQRITATSGTGKILIVFHDVEVNAELPPATFTPPRRAEKQP